MPIRPYNFQPLDLGVICGGNRCFKTAHAVRLIRIAYEAGYEVYTNLLLKGIKYTQLDYNDKAKVISQLDALFERVESEGTFGVRKFLFLDEFHGIVDSQDWKNATFTSDIWTQLGKMGFTTYVTNQCFNMTYNRYRENANKQVVTKRAGGSKYIVYVGVQSARDFDEYNFMLPFKLDASWIFNNYNTHQLMYKRRKNGTK